MKALIEASDQNQNGAKTLNAQLQIIHSFRPHDTELP